ncbi:ATPase family AAA domain-containing protein 5 isoform X1 [Acanthochromis polyacanthus]|uniref:ATPase family AAA domain-containing protein 5 isoform X1 n=1 Tax=Acanthochromis polyacanthus TaxID=80966 RepID=UPI002233EC97|nr:ATPase family AAA domain-containing protein 5 isoform X1 [Acanthochromis polyacanthus]
MAGVVTMASVIEDFDTQPCKKSRKDGGSPVVKTITNYFSPVVKPMEKPFSPPRSNNIMDYFSRKAPSSKEKSPEQSKENCQRPHSAEKHTSPEVGKQPPQKRGRKASRAARKLVAAATVSSTEEKSCIVVEERHESQDSAAAEVSTTGILGSDTAALLAQLSADGWVTAGKSKADEWAQSHEGSSKCGNKTGPKPALNTTELSPIAPSRDEAKQVKTAARNTRKRQQQEAKHSETEEKEAESSLCDVSMEVNLDEDSELNNSTVRISFEDFVRSQSQDEAEEDVKDEQSKEDGSKNTAEAEEMHSDQLDFPKAEESPDSGEPSVQVSPRTVTIQAEVHAVSPKPAAAKAVGKLASIFNRRKGVSGPAEVVSSPPPQPGHQLLCPSLTSKRKSNVVLQEEDLELAVLESESIPKCSEAERKQFMAAFKQPSMDGSKTKAVKSQGKQKQPGENVLEAAEDADVSPVSAEEASQEKTATKKKPAKRGRKKAEEEKEATSTSPPAVEEQEATTVVEVEDKTKEPPVTSAPSVPAARRSRRPAAVQPAPETTPRAPVRRTRKQNEMKDAADAASPPDSPAEVSTPKTRKSKRGVFVAEMLSPPDEEESPIRIKFTRVHRNASKTEGGSGINTMKTSSESKKRKQAKKLVEKAKVIQQNKKGSAEEKSSLRRSSRTEASVRRSSCEDEDAIICVEEDQTDAPQKNTTQKPLRSLNDVLGKAALSGKDTKAAPGSKVASLGQEKAPRRASAVISIFDESSHEGSENSQDDEQFRARREFLKSGLPESFRKQIAKTAATKEAYSLSCSTFQPVAHTAQPPNDCRLWSLSWPESSLLGHLKEFSNRTSKPLPSVGGSLCVKTIPACRSFCERGSGWRPEISESVRQLLIEEFSTSNPQFPAQKFITHFLKRRTEHQQQFAASEPEALTRTTSTPLPAESAGGKRKRRHDDGENTGKVAKKQRSSQSEENISTAEPEPTRRGGRTRRAQRSKLEEENAKPSPIPAKEDSVLILDDVILGAGSKDVVKEDVLWTDKYQPQHSSDIIDNGASVRRLHSWLKEWKLRADREERKKQKDKKLEEGSNDSDWDCGEEDSQDSEDMLCNTMLITGPTGVGKTAAVYACAQELGFKVFEVNASSQRSGRLILSQLKEATQSHQVDSQGVNAHKPTYFNSYGTSSSAGSVRPGTSPRKVNSPRRVVSSPRKHPQSPRGSKRGNLAPTSLANFFKICQPANKEPPNTTKAEKTAASKKKSNEGVGKQTTKLSAAATPKEKNSEEQSKKTATSLILFEEVDVIFDDDSGFLAAIKTFMTTTKRPVILTTSDPAFSSMFDGSFEEILFKTPSLSNVSSYLQLLCLAEDMRTDPSDISSLLKLNSCDIRQSLLQLQFWTRSSGGRRGAEPSGQTSKNAKLKPEAEEAADVSVLPPCDTGCTESKLGLLNVKPEADVWELLRQSPGEEAVSWELLTDSRQRGVDLLYSNMEKLLPLPLTQLTTSTFKPEQSVPVSQDRKKQPSLTCLQPDSMPPDRLMHSTDLAESSEDGSPVKVSTRMRKNKRQHHLADQGGLQSDSEDEFLSLSKQQSAAQAKEETKDTSVSLKKKPLTPEEREKSLPVSQCLESIADFFDNMSYMDSSLMFHPHGADLHRRASPVSAVLKDGMTDELRVEADGGSWMTGGHVLEIQAAVEALSFHKCRASVSESWEKVQQIGGELGKEAAAELSLPVAAHRDGYSFTQDGFCQPQLVRRRREVMESLMLKGVCGNKPAAALDYLPILRSICRSEQLKEREKVKRRFLHYLDAIHLGLAKSTLQGLAEDFL